MEAAFADIRVTAQGKYPGQQHPNSWANTPQRNNVLGNRSVGVGRQVGGRVLRICELIARKGRQVYVQSAVEFGEELNKSVIAIGRDVLENDSKHNGGAVCGWRSDAVTEGADALACQEDLDARLLESSDGVAELAQLAEGVHELDGVLLV
ncbi:hypothetical protein PG988_000607 [Apiospora saccharicola]